MVRLSSPPTIRQRWSTRGQSKKRASARPPPALSRLRAILYKHVIFTGKSPATQRSIRSYVDRLVDAEGDKPVALLLLQHVQKRVNVFANAGKAAAARNLLIAIRLLLKVAVEVGWLKKGDDPTAGIELPKIKGKGYRTWAEDEAATYEADYPHGTRERLIYEAYACTALRRSDMARLGRQHLRPRKQVVLVGGYKVTHDLILPDQHKTGEPLELPVLPSLQAAIDALPADQLMFFTAPDGSPLSGKRIADILARACKAIGLAAKVCDASGRPKGLCGHGLRKRMAKRLAEEFGCSEFEIMSVLGQKDPWQARTYTAAASRKRMAENALFKLGGGKATPSESHTAAAGLHTGPKIGGNKGE